MVEAAPTRAAEKIRGYPACSMAGMRTAAVPVASATAEPDMPAMIMFVTPVTWPRPAADSTHQGLGQIHQALGDAPWFISSPARKKKGMASRTNESAPTRHPLGHDHQRDVAPDRADTPPRPHSWQRPRGTPEPARSRRTPTSTRVIMSVPPPVPGVPAFPPGSKIATAIDRTRREARGKGTRARFPWRGTVDSTSSGQTESLPEEEADEEENTNIHQTR